jgi:hypothetical protein
MSKEFDVEKEIMWQMYWEGYKHAKDVEKMNDVSRRAARTNFEQYYERNYE